MRRASPNEFPLTLLTPQLAFVDHVHRPDAPFCAQNNPGEQRALVFLPLAQRRATTLTSSSDLKDAAQDPFDAFGFTPDAVIDDEVIEVIRGDGGGHAVREHYAESKLLRPN